MSWPVGKQVSMISFAPPVPGWQESAKNVTYCASCHAAGHEGPYDVVHAVFVGFLLSLPRRYRAIPGDRRWAGVLVGRRRDDGTRPPEGSVHLADKDICVSLSHLGDRAMVRESRWHSCATDSSGLSGAIVVLDFRTNK